MNDAQQALAADAARYDRETARLKRNVGRLSEQRLDPAVTEGVRTMCATFQAFLAAAGLFGILATAAFAQDMNVNRQVREGKGPTADGGMTLGEKDSVSFDARGNMVKQSAGFWKGLPGKLYTVALIDPKTGNSVAIVEFQGTLRWNASGRVGQMLDEFQARNIKTMSSKDQWLEVKSFVVEDGRLRIAASNGETFLIDGFSPYFQAQIATTAVVR